MMLRFIIILLLCGFYVTGELLGLDEGSRCLWNNNPGVCVSVYKCLSTFIDLENKMYPPTCSFREKEPIICCTDCEFVNDTRKMIIDGAFGILYKTGKKSEDACTEFKHNVNYPCKLDRLRTYHYLDRTYDKKRRCWPVKINIQMRYFLVQGVDAKRAEFPHMALLGYGPDIDSALWLCGGTLISERYILTAGHCSSHPKIGEVKYIALGILSRLDPPEIWQKYEVKRIITHPEYQPPSKYNDIALLETTKEIKFGEFVRPACLHTKGEAEKNLSTTGWGALGPKKQLADTLQAIYINRYEEEECSKHYPPHRLLKTGYNHTTQMCYGDKLSVKDSCEGDSGGPLQSLNYDEHGCVFTVLGVTSAGKQCGITAGSGLYTRVYYYVPWIESIVWP